MKILGIIPARKNSKRLPGKNTKLFNQKPLISHIIETSLKSKMIDYLCVSSDCEDVIKIASNYQNIQCIKRPNEMALDDSRAIEYVNHAVNFYNQELNVNDIGIIVILQPTSPLTISLDIDITIKMLIDTKADSCVSVVKVSHMLNPFKLKTLENDKLKDYYDSEGDRMHYNQLPEVYVRNCAVYATKIQSINQGKIIGDDCRAYIMPSNRSVDINDDFDFKYAEFLFQNLFKN